MAQLKARAVYTPRPDTTPEGELNALAAIYKFLLDNHAKNPAAGPSERGKDGTKVKEDSAGAPIIRQKRVRHS